MATEMNVAAQMKEIAAETEQLAVLWTGNDGWLLSDGKSLLAMDLDFYLSERMQEPPISVKDLAPHLDLLMISHAHDDHFNGRTVSELVRCSDCHFLLPVSCHEKADQVGIPENRRLSIQPGQTRKYRNIEFSAIRALHGHMGQSVYKEASLGDCGYRFELAGCTIYQPGDTILLQEHLEMTPVDLLFVSPTDHNTHIEPSSRMIAAIEPRWIMAQHFGTYRTNEENAFWTKGYPEELKKRLPESLWNRFFIPKAGEVYLFRADNE